MNKQTDHPHRSYSWLFYARFYVSQIMAFFLNPRVLVWIMAQAVGQLTCWAEVLRRGRQSRLAVPVSFPLNGSWLVANGGATRKNSHSWSQLSQRYAYDFTIDVDAPSQTLEGWPAFGSEVYAVKDGEIIGIMNKVRDHTKPGTGWIDWCTQDPRGNWVLIDHGDGVFALYAHLRQGSVVVSLGQKINRGEQIGSCGNSGFSTEPHLHFQLQNSRNFFLAHGILPVFNNVVVTSDKSSEDEGVLTEGQTVKRMNKTQWLANLPTFRISADFEPIFVSFVTLIGIFFAIRAIIKIVFWFFTLW